MSENVVREISSAMLEEKYYCIDHKSGLRIYVYPKEGYSSSFAVFGTNYGSIDTCFKLDTDEAATSIPEGTAHFLEHKLFESEDLDAFERFAKTGASANAYTSFDKTGYLFSCSTNFIPSLEILLDFVQSPYFTKETVEKEQGIIGQEIRMYDDVPDWKVLFNMLGAMYHSHPVKIDIAGTQESISRITDKVLYKCYNTFYNLYNMVLCVAGNVSVDEVLDAADRLLKPAEKQKVQRIFPVEPDSIVESSVTEKMSVAVPVFCLGYKEKMTSEEVPLADRIKMSVLLEILAGNTSELYQSMLTQGIINTNFGFEHFTGGGYSAVIFSGESSKPEKVREMVESQLKKLRSEGISEECFERSRKMLYGKAVMGYNSVEGVANAMMASHFMGVSLFDELDIYKKLTVRDIEEVLHSSMDAEKSVLSVILPA